MPTQGSVFIMPIRKHCIKKFRLLQVVDFINYVTQLIQANKWSVDACVDEAIVNGRYYS